jgi:hypothetical protein
MGIKFHCPNGHKLNVKSFLAGKKGRCPKCGTKVRIPAASEPSLQDHEIEETDAEARAGNGSAAHIAPVEASVVGAHAATVPSTPLPGVPPAMPLVGSAAAVAAPPVAPATGAASAAGDPISEAPAAVWYVRPPTGGQYGPARGEIMRRWLDEGRVSSDSLVWREGWSDWRTAGLLFPHLQAAGAAAHPRSAAPIRTAQHSTQAVTHYQAKQRGNSGFAIAAIVSLGLLILVLGGVLFLVLRRA